MKHKILCMAMSVWLLAACGGQTEDTSEERAWKLEADYTNLHSNMRVVKRMEQTDGATLLFLSAEGERGSGGVVAYLNDEEEPVLFDDDPSSSCSLQDPAVCSSFSYGDDHVVYKGKLYYIESEYKNTTDGQQDYIYRSELDGTKREKLFQIPDAPDAMYPAMLEFHKDQVYFICADNIYIGNADTFALRSVEIPGVKGIDISSIFFDDDTVYLVADEYEQDGKLHFDVALRCDLDLQVKEMVAEDKNIKFIDDDFLFYNNMDTGSYAEDRNTQEQQKLMDSLVMTIFYHDGVYLLDNTVYNDDQPMILLMDKEGNVFAKKELKGTAKSFYYPQIFMGDRYYVFDGNEFGYFEIKGDTISDYQILLDMEQEGS